MITNIKAHPNLWNKTVYIATRNSVNVDGDDNEYVEYNAPVEYQFNCRPVSAEAELVEFGVKASIMQRAVIPIKYKDMFTEFDVAYLEGATPQGETYNGENANYKLWPPRNGNSVIILYFEKIIGK